MKLKKKPIDILELYMNAHIDRNKASIALFVSDYYSKFNIAKNVLKSYIVTRVTDQIETEEDEEVNEIAYRITDMYCRSNEYYLSDNDEYHLSDEAKTKFLVFVQNCYENLEEIKNMGADYDKPKSPRH